MQQGKLATGLVAAVVCTGLLVSVPGASAEPAVAPPGQEGAAATGADTAAHPSTVARGIVRNLGTPVAGADVIVYAWPENEVLANLTTGESASMHLVGTTSTRADGSFSVPVDPADLPDWVLNDQARADLEVVVADSSRQIAFDFTVEAVPAAQRSTESRTWTVLAGETAPGRQTAPNMRFDLGHGIAYEVANDPARWVDKRGREYGQARRNEAAQVSVDPRSRQTDQVAGGGDFTTMETCSMVAGQSHPDRPEHFLNVYAWSGAKGTVIQTTGVDHTLGVGVTSGNGWSASGTRTVSFSAAATQGSIVDSSVWNRVNYRDYSDSCTSSVKRLPIGYSDLLSNDWAQVAHTNHTAYCTIKYPDASWQTGSAENRTFGGGVDIGPINVSAQSGYDNGMDLKFTFNSKSKICGNNSQGLLYSSTLDTRAP